MKISLPKVNSHPEKEENAQNVDFGMKDFAIIGSGYRKSVCIRSFKEERVDKKQRCFEERVCKKESIDGRRAMQPFPPFLSCLNVRRI